jgi:hypothetical protein
MKKASLKNLGNNASLKLVIIGNVFIFQYFREGTGDVGLEINAEKKIDYVSSSEFRTEPEYKDS